MKIIYFLSFLLFCVFNDAYALKCTTDGFIHLDNNCYWISRENISASWLEAMDYCKGMNASLATIRSDSENRAILTAVKGRPKDQGYWIAASDMQVEGKFVWLSRGRSEPIKKTYFYKRQPDNAQGIENCVELRGQYHFFWNDGDCSHRTGFICKYSP